MTHPFNAFARLDYPTGTTPLDRLRALAGTGMNTLLVSWPNSTPYCFGWDGRDRYDYRPYELLLESLLREQADLKFILSFGSLHGAPQYWAMDHPEELMVFNLGRRSYASSLASDLWRHQTSDAAERLAAHFANGPLADRVVGFYPYSTAVDWHGAGETNVQIPSKEVPSGFDYPLEGDFSEPMRRAFRAYLTQAYADDAALQEAWRDSTVRRETAELPSRVEVRSPLPKVRDYFACYNRLNAQLAAAWSSALKRGAPGRVVGISHAFAFGWPQQNIHPQGSGHNEPAALLADDGPDVFISSATRPLPALCPLSQHAVGSLKLHGKRHVHVIEAQSLVNRTPEEQARQIALGVGYAATLGSGIAFGEPRSGPGSLEDARERFGRIPYDDDTVRDHVKRLAAWHAGVLVDGGASVAEVAVFVSPTGCYHRSLDKAWGDAFVSCFRDEVLCRAGLPFDEYLLGDFEAVADRYKAWILLDAADIAGRAWDRVKREPRRAVFGNGTGPASPAALRQRLQAAGVTPWCTSDDALFASSRCVAFAAYAAGEKAMRLPAGTPHRLRDVLGGETLLARDGMVTFTCEAGGVRLFDRI